MKISARNCLKGTIIAIKEGPVTTEVTIETEAKEKIVSSITTASAQSLGLKVDRKSTRLNSSHPPESRMPSSA